MTIGLVHHRLSRLLALLPATAGEIASDLEVNACTVRGWLQALRAAGMVALGPMTRAGRVHRLEPGRPYERKSNAGVSAGVLRFIAAWRLLARRQSTASLAAGLGAHPRTAWEILHALRMHGHARICGYVVSHQALMPLYDRLPLADVPRPAPQPRVQTNARYWARRRERLQRAQGIDHASAG